MFTSTVQGRFKRGLAVTLGGFFLLGSLFLSPAAVNARPVPLQKSVEFSLTDLQNGTVTSASVQGKITVMMFGAKGLPLMRESLQQLQRVADRYPEINVYAVLTNGNKPKDVNYVSDEDLKNLLDANSKFNVTVLRDPNGDQLFKKLGLRVLPSLIVLNRKGELAAAAREGLDPNANLASQLSWEIDQSQ